MGEIVYKDGLKWKTADFRLKIQYSMSVLLIVAGVVLAFLSFLILKEIGMGVLSASTLFISAALGIYGIGMLVKNQMVDIQVAVDKKIRQLEEKERRYEKRHYTDDRIDDFNDAEPVPDAGTGEYSGEDKDGIHH